MMQFQRFLNPYQSEKFDNFFGRVFGKNYGKQWKNRLFRQSFTSFSYFHTLAPYDLLPFWANGPSYDSISGQDCCWCFLKLSVREKKFAVEKQPKIIYTVFSENKWYFSAVSISHIGLGGPPMPFNWGNNGSWF